MKRVERVLGRPEPPPELCVYRDRTTALLRRYLRMSLATGKMPTLLGRGEQFFRARVTSYKLHSFEDVVIFVHDMERCLQRLDHRSQQVIARVVLEEYSYDEAAPLLGISRRTLARAIPVALDSLSEILLQERLMEPFGFDPGRQQTRCQPPPRAA